MKRLVSLLLACVLLLAGCGVAESDTSKAPELVKVEQEFEMDRQYITAASRFWASEKLTKICLWWRDQQGESTLYETTDPNLLRRWAKWLENIEVEAVADDPSLNHADGGSVDFVVGENGFYLYLTSNNYISLDHAKYMKILNADEVLAEYRQLALDTGVPQSLLDEKDAG